METFIRTRTASLYDYWRGSEATSGEDHLVSPAVLLASVWIVGAIALILFFNRETLPLQFNLSDLSTADLNTPQQVAYQQFANRYKDPLCAYFLNR